ncbi:hypothetical protein J8J14_09480 [Roseomonas sp. SSH11]|uniref:Uncharacterized protein n=1 Tax=Pararoseomonas baculiformis TaxID=2820812 RepID=A0ABS4ADB7_9PROT|nr:hypothetical protein [Pararoseomonas baculiformis]MBP0445010.1 hypothetical protein [Pararoseomonas baculiformis]
MAEPVSTAPRSPHVPMVPHDAAHEAARILVQQQKWKEEREAAAAGTGSVTLVAITDFTVVDNPDQPEGRVVHAGDEFTVSLADLPRYAGRGMPKAVA